MNAIAPIVMAPDAATIPVQRRPDPWYDDGANSPTDLAHSQTTAAASQDASGMWGEDGFTFGDILDVINPLHHLPFIGSVYRKISEDQIAPAAQLAGGALYGGGIGAAVAGANLALKNATGKDAGEMALSMFEEPVQNPPKSQPNTVAVAAATPSVHIPAADSQKPAAKTAPAADIPQLSPQAFSRLMRAVENNPPRASEEAAVPSQSSNHTISPKNADIAVPDHRRAALELHRLLEERYQRPQQSGLESLPALTRNIKP